MPRKRLNQSDARLTDLSDIAAKLAGKLSDYFAETESDVYLVLHEEGAERHDITRWGSSAYRYTFTGGKVKLVK